MAINYSDLQSIWGQAYAIKSYSSNADPNWEFVTWIECMNLISTGVQYSFGSNNSCTQNKHKNILIFVKVVLSFIFTYQNKNICSSTKTNKFVFTLMSSSWIGMCFRFSILYALFEWFRKRFVCSVLNVILSVILSTLGDYSCRSLQVWGIEEMDETIKSDDGVLEGRVSTWQELGCSGYLSLYRAL